MNINPFLLFPLCGIGLGLLLITIVSYLYIVSRKMDQWQATQGIITKSNIKQAGAAFSPDVQYQYFVSGIEYTGMSLTITLKQTYKQKIAQKWIAQYPVGKKIDVFYNPERHQMAVLEKGFSIKSAGILIGVSLFLMLTSCSILFVEFR